jgi:SAM-dependent methyltransferase
LKIEDVPVFCNVQWSRKDLAINAPVGTIALEYCRTCSHIFNTAFEPEKLEYSESYESSLHFSPYFQAHAEGLVDRLVEKYDIREKTVVEIGCGKGEFISMLCEAGNNRGYGFDASYELDRESRATSDAVMFIKDFYCDKYEHVDANFVCCRHVLEHIQYPIPFLREVKKAAGKSKDCVVYFEVPNAMYSIEDMGIWDLIYEHCSYFSEESAATAFHKAGLSTSEIYTEFGNQFLCVEASTGSEIKTPKLDQVDLAGREKLVTDFSRSYDEKLSYWNDFLTNAAASMQHIVVWGAGSKGVTFLNCINDPESVSCVVDINPNKDGKFVAGTGHEIVSLERLAEISPTHVIIMNSLYKSEIESALEGLGIDATVSCA